MGRYDVYATKKGTELPLMSLKGKPYMQVAHRLVWFTEEVEYYSIKTDFPKLTDDETVAHVRIEIYDANGKVIKSAEATKREDKKSFADHTEKAETGAIGRCLALLSWGTQFAIADLDEGERLADAPVAVISKGSSGTITINGGTSGSVAVTKVGQPIQADVVAGATRPTFSKSGFKKATPPTEDII